jgi:hypothetical protein
MPYAVILAAPDCNTNSFYATRDRCNNATTYIKQEWWPSTPCTGNVTRSTVHSLNSQCSAAWGGTGAQNVCLEQGVFPWPSASLDQLVSVTYFDGHCGSVDHISVISRGYRAYFTYRLARLCTYKVHIVMRHAAPGCQSNPFGFYQVQCTGNYSGLLHMYSTSDCSGAPSSSQPLGAQCNGTNHAQICLFGTGSNDAQQTGGSSSPAANVGAVAGGVIAGVVVLAAVGGVVWWKKRTARKTPLASVPSVIPPVRNPLHDVGPV